jgi:hypothetical protein
MKDGIAIVLVLSAVAVLFYMVSQGSLFSSQQPAVTGGEPVQTGPGFAASTVYLSSQDVMAGGAANVNVELWQSSPEVIKVTVANAATDGAQVSTAAPTSLAGYAIAGNDDRLTQSPATWTDRGTEFYLKKIPVGYANAGTYTISDAAGGPVKFSGEGTATLNGFDNGALESPLNVTVGTSIVDTTEIQLIASANACIGNPEFDGNAPVMVTFNASNSNAKAYWDEIRPLNYVGTVSAPTNMTGETNVIGGVGYILPYNAICDKLPGHDSTVKFGIRMKPNAGMNPGTGDDATVGDGVSMCIWDKTYYKGDDGLWHSGYEKPRGLAAPQDIGMSSRATNCIAIATT